jgi:hypothetical protein
MAVDYVAVPMENKRHTDEDVLNKMPHPVRMKLNKKRAKEKDILRKPASEILEEFNILSGMITVHKTEKDETSEYQKVLDVLTLQESTDYNDLWEEILSDINVNKQDKPRKAKLKKI